MFAGILAFIAFINILFYFFSADSIVSLVGAENTYIIIFILATVGGLSSISGIALFTTIITFVAGGANPLLITLVGGTGIFISDSIFYLLALHGRKSVPQDWDESLSKIESLVEKYPPWMVFVGTYIYIGFTPLPNDLLMVALVIGGYSYKKIARILLAGSFTIAMVTAYFGYMIFI